MRAAAAALLTVLLTACSPTTATPAAVTADASPAPVPLRTVVLERLQAVQLTGQTYPGDAPATAEFGRPELVVRKDITRDSSATSSAALAFSPVPVPKGCLRSARLVASYADGPGTSGADLLRAYPSSAFSLAQGRVPPNGDAPTALLDNRPVGTVDSSDGGALVLDVTDLVALWTAGGPFPAQGRYVPEGTPLVLVLRTPDLTDGSYGVVVPVTADSPRLEVDVVDACR